MLSVFTHRIRLGDLGIIEQVQTTQTDYYTKPRDTSSENLFIRWYLLTANRLSVELISLTKRLDKNKLRLKIVFITPLNFTR